MKIISIVMNKGGTGKTELALNLAYGIASKGKRVLFCDLDPQGNATSILLDLEKELTEKNTADFEQLLNKHCANKENSSFVNGVNALNEFVNKLSFDYDICSVLDSKNLNAKELSEITKKAIKKSRITNLDILPASKNLSITDMSLKSQMSADLKLRMALREIKKEYDYVVIDNQPFENALTYNALGACKSDDDLIIIPLKINRGGFEGLASTINSALNYLNIYSSDAQIKMVISMKNNNKTDKTLESLLKNVFEGHIFDTSIRYQAKPIEEASLENKILLEYDKKSKYAVTNEFWNLVDEVLNS